MFDSFMFSGSCLGGLFMGVFWFFVIMVGISLFKSLTSERSKKSS